MSLVASTAHALANFMKVEPETDELKMDFLQFAKDYGYPVMHNYITTADGYILDLYRIPGPKGESLSEALENVKSQNRKPVLLSHGMNGNVHAWTSNGDDKAWGYVLP